MKINFKFIQYIIKIYQLQIKLFLNYYFINFEC